MLLEREQFAHNDDDKNTVCRNVNTFLYRSRHSFRLSECNPVDCGTRCLPIHDSRGYVLSFFVIL